MSVFMCKFQKGETFRIDDFSKESASSDKTKKV